MMDPWSHGYADYGNGRHKTENPYDVWEYPLDHEQWLDGWYECEEQIGRADE